ncbi:MAG: hypothetical protein Pg6B_10120 [Candidatus Azobacteroides pseudotrichonymphae]|nr:MAG: hypothetical protein Pg6B_10120 [Candidatus Azobacteroides pseudotrichonymphae]
MKNGILFLTFILSIEAVFPFSMYSAVFPTENSNEQKTEAVNISVTVDEKTVQNDAVTNYVNALAEKKSMETKDLEMNVEKKKLEIEKEKKKLEIENMKKPFHLPKKFWKILGYAASGYALLVIIVAVTAR